MALYARWTTNRKICAHECRFTCWYCTLLDNLGGTWKPEDEDQGVLLDTGSISNPQRTHINWQKTSRRRTSIPVLCWSPCPGAVLKANVQILRGGKTPTPEASHLVIVGMGMGQRSRKTSGTVFSQTRAIEIDFECKVRMVSTTGGEVLYTWLLDQPISHTVNFYNLGPNGYVCARLFRQLTESLHNL